MKDDDLLDGILASFGINNTSGTNKELDPKKKQILDWYDEFVRDKELFSSDWYFERLEWGKLKITSN